jgi:hypothetical protein
MHTPPSPLRLTAWNVLAPVYAALDDPRGWYHAVEAWTRWDYRKPRLLARLQASDADVLCLQECAADLLVSEDDALGDGRWRARWVRRGPSGDGARVAVLWRAERLSADAPDAGLRAFDRGLSVRLRCAETGHTLRVASVHLSYSTVPDERRDRMDAALAALVAERDTPTTLCAGDFNFDPVAHPDWPRWAAAGWASTHPAPDLVTWGVGGRTEKADAILYPPGLPLVDAASIEVFDVAVGLPWAHAPSDHVPLTAAWAWPPGKGPAVAPE